MHIEIISNGMGSQSMMMMVLAAEGKLSARLSITGDTGTENDCVWNTGERTTAYDYFERVIEPYAHSYGIEATIVRKLDRHKRPLPAIGDILVSGITAGVPLFGSNGGRLPQGCTGKYKIGHQTRVEKTRRY